ncbi:hypothetical protein MSI_05470 [Treponema sp. JC4]|uniref:hypothetical protein n=1 Tax=Treponema sp. JC4 TaxID=1124982 RepID=UPI00025B0A18|nr:hypothetical protein [Treponema sp. JC4]EID85728.1 hypothetical protein MSI_05470 [Treponema sp. JC4]
MISNSTYQELIKLLNNPDFIKAASQCKSESDINPLLKRFGITLSEEELSELLEKKAETMKLLSEAAEIARQLTPLLEDHNKAEEFFKITTYESFMDFCKENNIVLSDNITSIARLIFELMDGVVDLSDDALSSVAGGNALAAGGELGAGMIPCIGGVASAVVSVADGSVKGTEKITARLAVGVATSLFETVATISTGGMLSIGQQWHKEGFTSDVKQKLAMFGGIKALSSITSFAVGQALS